jgi:hypothetical protein
MVALGMIVVMVVVVEGIVRGMYREGIVELIVVGAVVVVGGGISYLSLGRRRPATGRVSVGEAVFTWSVVVLAAFTALLFLIS